MAKYIVKKKCYGFLNKYWEIGDILEIDDNIAVPKYFERIDKPKTIESKKEVVKDDEIESIEKVKKSDIFKNKKS